MMGKFTTIAIAIALILFGCGSNKKVSKTVQDNSQIEEENLSKIDTSKTTSFNDSLETSTKVIVREYELITFRDTVITYLTREVSATTSTEKKTSGTETQKGGSETSVNVKKDLDIKTEKEEEKEIYDPDWIKYVFWILLLLVVVAAFLYFKKYLTIFN